MLIKLSAANERALRRFAVQYDPDFAFHPQLKNYFLTDSDSFGTFAKMADGKLLTVIFYSRYNDKTYIHRIMGDINDLDELVDAVGWPAQAFIKAEDEPQLNTKWIKEFSVTPGYVIDHSAYNGVFSRVAPRFNGGVYERSSS